MPDASHAFSLLEKSPYKSLPSMVVCFGSDSFLRQKSILALITHSDVLPESVQTIDNEHCKWADVHESIATRSLFDAAGPRACIVRNANDFVSSHRDQLERFLSNPMADATLVLDVTTFPATTKLYKAVAKSGLLVDCNPPMKGRSSKTFDDAAIQTWIGKWAKSKHAVSLSTKQTALLVDRVGANFGLLDCEIAKLALFADSNGDVEHDKVRELVGGWRTNTAWEIAEQIADGKLFDALEQLDRLIKSGQSVIGLSAQLSWYFRRFGVAAQLVEQEVRMKVRPNIAGALLRAGFRQFDLASNEKQLRRIGSKRASQILEWLRDLDLRLKGSHSQEDRARSALEEFMLKLA